jgi:hypothetical protein
VAAPDPTPSPLELLQRAQFLHDSTLRRHSERLDQHATEILLLRQMAERQERMLQSLQDIAERLTTATEAIKDMLGRSNGH